MPPQVQNKLSVREVEVHIIVRLGIYPSELSSDVQTYNIILHIFIFAGGVIYIFWGSATHTFTIFW